MLLRSISVININVNYFCLINKRINITILYLYIYLIYAHRTKVRSATPIAKLQILEIAYKPTNPKTPLRTYIRMSSAKNTAGVLAAYNKI